MILASFLGKRERRSRSTFPPITFSSKWGEPIGSWSWSYLWISFVLLLISLHSISCFGEIWVRSIWALCVLLPLHRLHRFDFSPEIRVSESSWAYYSWVLGTLDGFVALWCLCGYSWEPPIKLWIRAPSFV
jgi:hypothetical protein